MISSTTRVILVRHGRSTFNDQGRYKGSSDDSVLTQQGLETARLVGTYFNRRFPSNTAKAVADRFPGRSIEPLSESPIDLIYTSPLRRVQQTAEAIAQAIAPSMRPPIVVNHDLKEISLSHWEGLTYAQVKQQYPQQYQLWQQRPEQFQLSVRSDYTTACSTVYATEAIAYATEAIAGSTMTQSAKAATVVATRTYFPVQTLYQAAQYFWKTVLPQHSGRTLLIVSHSGTIHALVSTALGLSPSFHHSLQQSNCGVSELTFTTRSPVNGPEADIASDKKRSDKRESLSSLGYDVQLHQLNQTSAIGERLPKIKVNKKGLRLLLLPSDSLQPEACKQLSTKIGQLPLDFCVAADITSSSLSALMQHCSSVLCLEAKTVEFLQAWRQQLADSPRSAEPLITALVVAPAASIQMLLMQTLGHRVNVLMPNFSAVERRCIALRPHHLSVVHYPYQHRPVVQAINAAC
ncbi:MAG: histidine phosphatase family protein [Phormidesmis sp.]